MTKRLILDKKSLSITLKRLCYLLVENHHDFDKTVILGLQTKGVFLADKISKILLSDFNVKVPIGTLDTTFNRDDYRKRSLDLLPNEMNVPFSLENKKVILMDDVLYTGRSIRAAMDAMLSFGRPASVELLVLIDRKYSRELPIEPKYCGKHVNTLTSEKVLVELTEQGLQDDNVWLITQ